MTIDQQFVEFIVKALVSKPDDVQINRSIDEKGVLLELSVAGEDLGRVIGKRGNTAQSIRTLLRALGTKNDARYNLKIIDPEGDQRHREREFVAAAAPAAVPVVDDNVSQDEPADAAAAEPASTQWAHLSSSNDDTQPDGDDSDNTTDVTEEEKKSSTESTSSVVEQTKKELADLGDLEL